MSSTTDDEKPEAGKTFPLDLAAKITTVKALDVKTPIIMTGQPLRNMRVLTQPVAGSSGPAVVAPTIITTNIVPQAIIKQCDTNRSNINLQPQNSTSITLQKPAQITLATSVPVVAHNTYHVPRGPAVVANLAAPRSNIASAIRPPMVVTQTNVQQSAFARPPRIPSPAQSTAWLTSPSTNNTHVKGAPAVLSSPVRGASAIKPQLLTRTQPTAQSVNTVRPTTATILHSAITIGQGTQIHPYKPGQGNTVTLAQVIPSRSQTLVYSASSNGTQFTPTSRLTITTTAGTNSRPPPPPKTAGQITTARLTIPLTVTPSLSRSLPTPTNIRSQHPLRIIATTSSNVSIGRNISVSVAAAPTQVSNTTVFGQTRISTLPFHPLVAVANSGSSRSISTPGTKVIAQPVQANTVHVPQISTVMKSTPLTTTTRTANAQPPGMITQRPISSGTAQSVSISKVFPQVETSQSSQPPTNLFLHTPLASLPNKSSAVPSLVSQVAQTTTLPTTTASTFSNSSASSTYFYDASGTYSVEAPSFSQQSSFAPVPQSNNQSIRSTTLPAQVHGIAPNRFNPVMIVDQQPVQVPVSSQSVQDNQQELSQPIGKINSSPRPSILRKRDHEGILLRAAKNLAPALGIVPLHPPLSPPSRPDSGGHEHSSGGSTTVSATSSPGLAEVNEDSLPASNLKDLKEEEENIRPTLEMSPRKKPRKQQLTGNDLNEPLQEDMQFLSESVKNEDSDAENRRLLRKPANATLLNSYRQTWKATHNHYVRYSDVRPKDERRPSIMDLSNQYRVLDKVNGWKVYHLSTQMEDLAEQEQNVYNQLAELLKDTEAEEGNGFDKDLNCINELIKGNLQRIKIINDGMIEAKAQIMKIFDHKMHVADIISRCASKRNFKKREKS